MVFSIVQKISGTSEFKSRAVFIMLTLCSPEDSISALNYFVLNLLLILPKDINVLTYKQQLYSHCRDFVTMTKWVFYGLSFFL